MFQFQSPINITDGDRITLGQVTGCFITVERTMVGHRLTFHLTVATSARNQDRGLAMTDLDVDLYWGTAPQRVLIGRLFSDIQQQVRLFDGDPFTLRKVYDLAAEDLLRWADKTHQQDLLLEFMAAPVFADSKIVGRPETGRLLIPQSSWLDLLNRSEMARFEFIALRTPVRASHLFQPFSEAIAKIRQAEDHYQKGQWNAAGGACRAAWRTVLSAVPDGHDAFEHLLQKVTGDPRRKEFARAMVKGLHDVLNKADHLEGNSKEGTPPADLQAADALLCIHWYSMLIGYLGEQYASDAPG